MPPATKTARHRPHGATRRSRPAAGSKLDRWLNALVSLCVTIALIVGGLALLVTLIFG